MIFCTTVNCNIRNFLLKRSIKLLFFYLCTDAKVQEKVVLRVFSRNNKNPSEIEVIKLLRRANLTSHGYKETVIYKLVEKESAKIVKQKVVHFTKRVACSQLTDVEKDMSSLLPGVFDSYIARRVQAEVAIRLSRGKTTWCTGGVEVHFPPPGGFCRQQGIKRGLGDGCPKYCLFCFWAKQ